MVPFPDAKVASTLCIAGPIKYVVRSEFAIDDDLILHCVGTNISSFFPRQTSLVFGLALIRTVYDDTISSLIHTSIIQKVKTNILNSNTNIEVDTNPIEKFTLVFTGCEGNLLIDQLTGKPNGKNATLTSREG